MRRLYALLVILIVLYVGINVSVNGFNILSGDSTIYYSENDTATGNASFPDLDNFSETKISNSGMEYSNNSTGINIEVKKINNSENLSDTYDTLSNEGSYTSSQEIDQNGVTAYFLYKERQSSYDTDIFFNKNNQNYKITGENVTYENSDYFINSCKQIIDSIGSSSSDSSIQDIKLK